VWWGVGLFFLKLIIFWVLWVGGCFVFLGYKTVFFSVNFVLLLLFFFGDQWQHSKNGLPI